MGICPCTRERTPRSSSDLPSDQPCQLTSLPAMSTTDERHSGLQVSVRACTQIIRLSEPLTSYYRNLRIVRRDGNIDVLSAQSIGSRQDCRIARIPKHVYQSSKKVKVLLFEKLKRLDHPHLLRTLEVCMDDIHYYVVSEACKGGDLAQFLAENGRLSQNQAATLLYQVLSALTYYHNLGFTHRHVCLQSLALKHKGELDIRVAGLYHVDSTLDSDIDEQFIAPELKKTEKSDIWSCGVVLHLLLTGRSPFTRSSEGSLLPCGPLSLEPSLTEECTQFLSLLLRKLPESRPSAMNCLSHAWLARYAERTTIPPQTVALLLSNLAISARRKPLEQAIMKFIISRVATGKELSAISKAFEAIDSDGDGLISLKELRKSFQTVIALHDPLRQAEKVLEDADSNKNGMIDYSEFLLAAFQEKEIMSTDMLKAAFATLDIDGNGKISIQELKHFFNIEDKPGTRDQWMELISDFGTSRDEAIDFTEFQAMMTKAIRS